MDIDLVLYRGPKYNKKYKLLTQTDIRKMKRKKQSKENYQILLHNLFLNENLKKINNLKIELRRMKETMFENSER